MLNSIAKNEITGKLSKVAGIPDDWQRSDYNKQNKQKDIFNQLLNDLDSKYLIISYSSEGFIQYEDMISMLENIGNVSITAIDYKAFKASRNYSETKKDIKEYLFIVEK